MKLTRAKHQQNWMLEFAVLERAVLERALTDKGSCMARLSVVQNTTHQEFISFQRERVNG